MRRRFRLMALILALCSASSSADAHLMVKQRGTLNVTGGGAYLVISLPVSAFAGVDLDGDERVSAAELAAGYGQLEASIRAGITLRRDGELLALDGLLINLASHDVSEPAEQVIAMGRFRLTNHTQPLRFGIGLFGVGASEGSYLLAVTRGGRRTQHKFSSASPTLRLPPATVADHWLVDRLRRSIDRLPIVRERSEAWTNWELALLGALSALATVGCLGLLRADQRDAAYHRSEP